MRNIKIDFNKSLKKVLLAYAVIFLAGIAFIFIPGFGVKLDINFGGGTKIAYSYTGDVKDADIEDTVKGVLDKSFTVSKSTSLAGDTKTFEIALVGKNSVSAEKQEELTKALTEKFSDNTIELYNSNSVSPTVAGSFFTKSIVAVLITALFVIIYVGIRFRRIGGISAAVTALCALVFDVFITFFTCVFFKLQLDSNYIAVVLTILGYSLNDTIVVYDRVRENERLMPDSEISDVVNVSINTSLKRNAITSLTTFVAFMTIVAVSELFGLSTLRTFAVPMAFGIVSGAVSSLFIAGPIWVLWKRHKAKKADNTKKK